MITKYITLTSVTALWTFQLLERIIDMGACYKMAWLGCSWFVIVWCELIWFWRDIRAVLISELFWLLLLLVLFACILCWLCLRQIVDSLRIVWSLNVKSQWRYIWVTTFLAANERTSLSSVGGRPSMRALISWRCNQVVILFDSSIFSPRLRHENNLSFFDAFSGHQIRNSVREVLFLLGCLIVCYTEHHSMCLVDIDNALTLLVFFLLMIWVIFLHELGEILRCPSVLIFNTHLLLELLKLFLSYFMSRFESSACLGLSSRIRLPIP